MIVSILRNSSASTKVIRSVVELLSVPLVLPLPDDELDEIKTVSLGCGPLSVYE